MLELVQAMEVGKEWDQRTIKKIKKIKLMGRLDYIDKISGEFSFLNFLLESHTYPQVLFLLSSVRIKM